MEPPSRIRRLFASSPTNRLLGIRLIHAGEAGAELHMPVRAAFGQEAGVVHGGLLTCLADTAAVYALLPSLPDERSLTGIDAKLSFLRPASPEGPALVARSRTVRLGRRVGVARVSVLQGDREVAEGLFTYLVLAQAPA